MSSTRRTILTRFGAIFTSLLTHRSRAAEAMPSGYVSDHMATSVNIKTQFNAYGDGIRDDTQAFHASFAYCREQLHYAGTRTIQSTGIQPAIYLPPGHYIYGGEGLQQNGGNIILIADPNTVTIEILKDVYFISAQGIILSTLVKGIHFLGGKGALRYLNRDTNVTGFHVVEDCQFDNYTECALGNNATDAPYLKIARNIFVGNAKNPTIGIALGGFLDSAEIISNSFRQNQYNLKIGPHLGGSIAIQKNDFIALKRGIREADIWIVPNSTDRFGTNSGWSTTIDGCKFGNENFGNSDVRILIAAEDESSGSDRLSRRHSLAWHADNFFVSGLCLSRNRIQSNGIATKAPFIQSHISNFNGLRWTSDNIMENQYSYLCEFTGTEMDEEAFVTRTWDVQLGAHSPAVSPFAKGISNRVVGLVRDPFGSCQGTEVPAFHSSAGDDVGFVLTYRASVSAEITVASAEKIAIRDAFGNQGRASEIKLAGSSANSCTYAKLSAVEANRITWVDVDLMRAETASVRFVTVAVRNLKTGKTALQESVNLQDRWRTCSFGFVMPDSTAPDQWQFQVYSPDFRLGATERFAIGTIYIYHAAQRMNIGHIRSIGDGRWNGQHLVLGVDHIWFDSNSVLRVKSRSAPTDDLDGSAVGTLPPCLVSDLPKNAKVGDHAYAIDGRNPGEATGAGSGCPVYYCKDRWMRFSDGSPVSA